MSNLDKLIKAELTKLKDKGIGGIARIYIAKSLKDISYKSIEAVRVKRRTDYIMKMKEFRANNGKLLTDYGIKLVMEQSSEIGNNGAIQKSAEKEKEFKGR